MLRYESVAEVGDTIRAYDFEPLPGRPEHWIEGRVIAKGFIDPGPGGVYPYRAFTILTEQSSWPDDDRVGLMSYVPFELGFTEWKGRVTKIENAAYGSTSICGVCGGRHLDQ